jgi:hypothetical protein
MSNHTQGFVITYKSGEEVREKDKVLAYSKREGIVEVVLKPRTPMAREYYVEEDGGILLRFDDGQIEVWVSAGAELKLVARG